MRLAWFTPLPPVRSGVARYSVNALPAVLAAHAVDVFVATAAEMAFAQTRHMPARSAHDFVWLHQQAPYDLIVYQIGNAGCHDYTWPSCSSIPGLVVLHDAHLHHARAASLLARRRSEDYAAELVFNHPDVPAERAALGIHGFGGPISYFWPMIRSVVVSARRVAVHNPMIAADLRETFEGVAIDEISLGVPDPRGGECGQDPQRVRARTRQRLGIAPDAFVILAYGGVTPKKRIRAAVRAIAATGHRHPDLRLLIVGPGVASDALAEARAAGIADCIAVTGYVADEDLPACLAAADAALCLRWPTARETSAAWVDCIAAGLPTVVTDLVHLAHIPTLEPLHWTVRHIDTLGQRVTPVAISVDMSDEVGLLARALRRLIDDAALRARLGDAARRHFERHHTIAQMAGDYLRVIDLAAATPPPEVTLPAHLRPDCWRLASSVGGSVGVDVRSAITGGSGGLPAVRADAGHACAGDETSVS